jgi:AraC family transcriptional regulator
MMHRIQRAQALPGDPRKTLADVALRAGFRNQAYFTTVFHRFVTKSSQRWRNALSCENTNEIW